MSTEGYGESSSLLCLVEVVLSINTPGDLEELIEVAPVLCSYGDKRKNPHSKSVRDKIYLLRSYEDDRKYTKPHYHLPSTVSLCSSIGKLA